MPNGPREYRAVFEGNDPPERSDATTTLEVAVGMLGDRAGYIEYNDGDGWRMMSEFEQPNHDEQPEASGTMPASPAAPDEE